MLTVRVQLLRDEALCRVKDLRAVPVCQLAGRVDPAAEGGELLLNYTIDVNADLAASNELKITVSGQ